MTGVPSKAWVISQQPKSRLLQLPAELLLQIYDNIWEADMPSTLFIQRAHIWRSCEPSFETDQALALMRTYKQINLKMNNMVYKTLTVTLHQQNYDEMTSLPASAFIYSPDTFRSMSYVRLEVHANITDNVKPLHTGFEWLLKGLKASSALKTFDFDFDVWTDDDDTDNFDGIEMMVKFESLKARCLNEKDADLLIAERMLLELGMSSRCMSEYVGEV